MALPEIKQADFAGNFFAARDQARQQQQGAQRNALSGELMRWQINQLAIQDDMRKRAATQEDQVRRARQTYSEVDAVINAPPGQASAVLRDLATRDPSIADAAKRLSESGLDLSNDEQIRQSLYGIRAHVAGIAGISAPQKEHTAPEQFTMTPGSVRYERAPDGSVRKVAAVPVAEKADTGPAAPSGYRWADGGLAPITGGPADPQGPAAKRQVAPLRKEFRNLESVKSYEVIVPLVKSAAKAPDTGYGDLQLIYTVGKVLDPGSVVREGELALTIKAGTMMSQIFGAGRFQLGKGGRIPSEQRKQIMEMLNERSAEYRNMYDRDYQTYTQYAQGIGINPYEIVGKHPDGEGGKPEAGQSAGGSAASQQPVKITGGADYARLPSGARYIAPDGSTRTKR